MLTQITALEREAWASVSKARPNRPSWGSADDAPVGRDVRARTTYRSFFQIDLRPIAGATVLQAMLEQPITSAVSCDVDSLEVWITGDIHRRTTWNDQPAWLTNVGPTAGSCRGHWLEADLTDVVGEAVAAGRTHITLGVRTTKESDPRGFKTLSNAPVISVTHNTAPDKPADLSMLSHFKPCGPDGLWIPTDAPQLNAVITDPDRNETGGGDNITGQFEWWRRSDDRKIGEAVSWSGGSGYTFSVTVPEGALSDGGTYAWRVRGYDDQAYGPWSDWCEITVDTVRPDRPPTVTSEDYPPTGGHGGVGVPGTFTFTSNAVDDIVSFRYGESRDVVTVVAADRVGGEATITYTPTSSGSDVLWVQSLDRAGNPGPWAEYRFDVN